MLDQICTFPSKHYAKDGENNSKLLRKRRSIGRGLVSHPVVLPLHRLRRWVVVVFNVARKDYINPGKVF